MDLGATPRGEVNSAQVAEFLKVLDFENHAERLQVQLAERHQKEHDEYAEKLRAEMLPRTPRYSRAVLDKRQVMAALVKQKRYPEAQKVRSEIESLEAKEHDQWYKARETKIVAAEDKYVQKQGLEMQGLLKRIQSGREEQRKGRKTELDRLLQRYANVKGSIETQQALVRQRADKYPQEWLHASISMSTSQAPRGYPPVGRPAS